MKYAIIGISGKQHRVALDDTLTVDLQKDKTTDDTITIDHVLLTVSDDKIQLGQPTIKGASVEAQVIKNYQGKKIRVFKYKAKSRYRKTQGFRPQLTDIKITKINYGTH